MLWETIIGTVIGGLILALLLALAGWAWARIRQRLGKRPDWTVEEQSLGYFIRRARRATAYQVRLYIHDQHGHMLHEVGLEPDNPIDAEQGAGFGVPLLNEARGYMLYWIDNTGRREAQGIWRPEDIPSTITARPLPKRRRFPWNR